MSKDWDMVEGKDYPDVHDKAWRAEEHRRLEQIRLKMKCRGSTAKGTPCRRWALENGFCAMHGGLIARAHADKRLKDRPAWSASRGLYSEGLFSEELGLYEAVKVGTLEEEIKLLKVQLRRAFAAQLRWGMAREEMNRLFDADPRLKEIPAQLHIHLDLESIEKKVSDDADGKPAGEERKLVRRKRDYMYEIKALIKLIAELETRHAELTSKSQLGAPEMLEAVAKKLREFDEESAATMPGKPEK